MAPQTSWSASSGEPCTDARKTSSPRLTQLWCAPRLSSAAQSGTLTTRSTSIDWTWYNGELPDLSKTPRTDAAKTLPLWQPWSRNKDVVGLVVGLAGANGVAAGSSLTWPRHRRTLGPHGLGWDSLQNRRLTMLYRVTKGLVEIPPQYHPEPHPQLKSTKRHPKQLQLEVNAYAYAFLPKTIKDWTALPSDVVAAESLDTFKQRLHPRQQWT